nr:hypothetical protein [Tanacetum cinerariifolium]
YKEYYAFATGEVVPKPKASARRKRSDSDTSITPPTATPTLKPTVAITLRLTAATKVKDGDDDEGDEGDESNEGEEYANEDKDGDKRNDDEENKEYAKYDEQDDAEGGRNDEEEMRMKVMVRRIKVVSRHQNTQQYGAMLPIELTNDEIRNTKAYKEYYAFATGEVVPKPKASARRKRSDSDTSITPPTATPTLKPTVAITLRLTAATKGTGSKLGVLDVPTDELEEELSWNSSDDEGVDD